MNGTVKVVPCRNVAEEGDGALGIVPPVLKPLLVRLAQINQRVSHDGLEKDARSLREVHRVAGLSTLHVPHHPVVVGVAELVGERADVLEGARVGTHVDPRGAALGKLGAVSSWGALVARAAVDPLLSLHLVDKHPDVLVDSAHSVSHHLDAGVKVNREGLASGGRGRRCHQVGGSHFALEAEHLCLQLESPLCQRSRLLHSKHHGIKRLLGHPVAVQRAVQVVNLLAGLLRPTPVGLGPPSSDAVEARGSGFLMDGPRCVDALPCILPRLRIGISQQSGRLGNPHLLATNVALHGSSDGRVELIPARQTVNRERGDEVLLGQAEGLVLEGARVLDRELLAGNLLDVCLGHAVGAQPQGKGGRLRGLGEGRGEGAHAGHLALGDVVGAVDRDLAGAEGGAVGEEDDCLVELLGDGDEEGDRDVV
mmetsp:Transcript_38246/g.95758  ORF Transcript_38246/g.95758 Transcript_38246/m.95758 type:complete len:424 (+) Transcript_38246:494-1765(+)